MAYLQSGYPPTGYPGQRPPAGTYPPSYIEIAPFDQGPHTPGYPQQHQPGYLPQQLSYPPSDHVYPAPQLQYNQLSHDQAPCTQQPGNTTVIIHQPPPPAVIAHGKHKKEQRSGNNAAACCGGLCAGLACCCLLDSCDNLGDCDIDCDF